MLIAGVKEAPEIAKIVMNQGYELKILTTNAACHAQFTEGELAHCLLDNTEADRLSELMRDDQVEVILDASSESSHLFNGSLSTASSRPRYVRYYREELELAPQPGVNTVFSFHEAVECLVDIQPRTVFLTTGSYELEAFCREPRLRMTRFVVRVLPDWKVIKKCQEAGLPVSNIVAMQGPFSKKINRILFKAYNAEVIVTRDSGQAGGTDTKILAAMELHIPIIVIKRKTPQDHLTACGMKQLEEILKK